MDSSWHILPGAVSLKRPHDVRVASVATNKPIHRPACAVHLLATASPEQINLTVGPPLMFASVRAFVGLS